MKTANGYLEFDNPNPGANDLNISTVQVLEGGEVRSAKATIPSSGIHDFIETLLSLRGILDEVNQQRPPREVEKIVQTTVQVAQPIEDIVSQVVTGVQAVLPVPLDPVPIPVDEIVSKVVEGIKKAQAPADPQPEQPAAGVMP